MNKEQLIQAMSHTIGADAGAFVEAMVKWVTEQVIEQGNLHIPELGMLEVQKTMEYVWVDSAARKRFLVPPRLYVRFIPDPLVDKESAENAGGVFVQMADLLVRQNKAERHVAERLPVAFFKLILEGMESGEPVEVPGLGAFLLTKVKVDNCTYGRVSFTPDEAFAAAVNRPFSYFSQVELNEGVDFDDVKTFNSYGGASDNDEDLSFLIAREEPVAAPVQEVPLIEEDKTNEVELPVGQEGDVSPEQIEEQDDLTETVEEELLPSSQNDTQPSQDMSRQTVQDDSEDDDDSSQPRHWGRWALGAVAALLCVGGIVKLAGGSGESEIVTPAEEVPAVAKVEKPDSVMSAPPTVKDTIDYAALNAQIPYGAYDIVGVDTVITVMKGQDLPTISRIFLGTDIQIYLIVLNEGNNDPQEGERYKIPKLKLRKR